MSAKPRCGDYVLHCIAGCGFAVPRISYGHDAPFPLIVSPLFIRRAYGLVSFLTASSGTQCLLVRQRVHTPRPVPVNFVLRECEDIQDNMLPRQDRRQGLCRSQEQLCRHTREARN